MAATLQVQMRRDTSANWTSSDPTLLSGELGYETNTGFWKVGDGTTAWTSLSYAWDFGGDVTVNGNIVVTGTVDGVDIAARDHDIVTFAGTGTYISLAGQVITVDPITESDISDLQSYSLSSHTHLLADGATDVTATATEVNLLDLAALTTNDVLVAASATTAAWRQLVEADISDFGSYSLSSHTHLLADGATDVTATATELNLLNLAGLTAGWVLSADTATTASWKAQTGGGGGTPGGSDTEMQYNNNGAFGGISAFVYDDSVTGGKQQFSITPDSTLTNGQILNVTSNLAATTGYMLYMLQDHASSTAEVQYLIQHGNAATLRLFTVSSTADCITASSNSLTTGSLLDLSADTAGMTGPLVDLHQDHASATAPGITILQDGTGPHINLTGVGKGIAMTGGILMTERADHANTPAATFSETWTRSGTTQALMFTDDAGLDTNLSIGSNLIGITYITANDAAWAPNADTKRMLIYATGAGGGGGGADGQGTGTTAIGIAGAGGGTAVKFLTTIDATYNITIGTAGAAGAAAAGNGGAGTATTVVGSVGPGTNCNLSGGGGAGGTGVVGASNNPVFAGVAGGVSTGGDMNITGDGSGASSIVAGEAAGVSRSGAGYYGGSVRAVVGATGVTATTPGAGGGVAISKNVATNYAGGAGFRGVVVIYEYS